MDRGTGSLTGFLPALIVAIVVVIGLRVVFGPEPEQEDETPPSVATSASIYQSQGVAAGHRLDCDAQGAAMEGPRSTVPPAREISCALDPAPNQIQVLVSYDVDPLGSATNVVLESPAPFCIEREVEAAISQWEYCPLLLRGEPQWRYGETILLTFTRRN